MSSRNVKQLVLTKAVEMWENPERRCVKGSTRIGWDGKAVAFCAAQVLLNAAQQVGLPNSFSMMNEMATWIGFSNLGELIIKNDSDAQEGDDMSSLALSRQTHRQEIFKRMKAALAEA